MRIAVSGTHRVGKSTLVEQLGRLLPDHVCVEEPYRLLEDEGHPFSWPPTVDDFVDQLHRSIAEVTLAGPDTLFDRCPADLIAYLAVVDSDVGEALERSRPAMQMLDLVVLVPIEEPDRIPVHADDDPEQRRAVADVLESLLLDDDLAQRVAVVRGDPASRAKQVRRVLNHLGG